MRRALAVLWMIAVSIASAQAQVSVGVGISLPGVSIGIHLPAYPTLVPVPGYPVYYAPQSSLNYFFYDGLYWVYQGDDWYASSWYNGPWWRVGIEQVPVFILRIPVRYYRRPPPYFRGWRPEAPPRWGEHWGREWEQRHPGWDRWDRHAVPPRAPLPVYQKQYSGSRYPRAERQPLLQDRNYRYQPREPVARELYQAKRAPGAPSAAPERRAEPRPGRATGPDPRGARPPARPEQAAAPREVQPPEARRPQPSPSPRGQHAPQPPRGDEKGRDRGEQRGGGRDR
jgi:hypothetical protein